MALDENQRTLAVAATSAVAQAVFEAGKYGSASAADAFNSIYRVIAGAMEWADKEGLDDKAMEPAVALATNFCESFER